MKKQIDFLTTSHQSFPTKTKRKHQLKYLSNDNQLQWQFSNYQNNTIVKMIGHEGLLQALSSSNTKYINQEIKQKNIAQDRFIPSRKLLKKQYSKMELQNQQLKKQEKDPQITSIAEIYQEQILGGMNQFYRQHVQEFRNNNLLKFRVREPIKNYNQICKYREINKSESIIKLAERNIYQRCRKVPKTPCKVLDAPALQDDFYLNLIDWSSDNQLGVGLGNCIYLWNAVTSKVTKLCQLGDDNSVSSVCWAKKGSTLAIGCNKGDVLVWDINYCKQIRKMGGHESRVGAMAWNSKILATGSRDKMILERDVRAPTDYIHKLTQHTQQICGLKWSHDEQYLASGGNDNKVMVWGNGEEVINKFVDHKAAVKALAWSPHQHGLLATGGGTADRMIKMRNIFTGDILCQKDAGSQVCNIAFSKALHQVVSTHGYSQNEINIWSYPNMKKTATLIGHTQRVLYLATSPDGSTIVTGAGDQTLRFWNIFPSVDQFSQTSKNISLIDSGPTLR